MSNPANCDASSSLAAAAGARFAGHVAFPRASGFGLSRHPRHCEGAKAKGVALEVSGR
jgi:hypothetical protein